MTPAARVQAAIDVLDDVLSRRRPAGDALKDWGLSHRFAGSGDRAAIAGLVYDALRRHASAAYLMNDASARATALGMLRLQQGLDPTAIAALASGARYAPAPLTAAETDALRNHSLDGAPPFVRGDYPEWMDSYFARAFGDARAEEGAALAQRAPLDLRVNTLKGSRDAVAAELRHLGAAPTRWSPFGLRIALAPDAKSPAVHAEPAFIKGMVELQDEGSQLAALFCGAQPGEQVVDLCAGGGGKTLALAQLMGNAGQIFSTDNDKRRLAPIHARIERAGTRNVQVRTPRGVDDPLSDLAGRIDRVLVDAPCTGVGTWRRNPDAKWRLRPSALELRMREQAAVLDRAAGLVRSAGCVVYVTCSMLAEENEDQVRAFLDRHPGAAVVPPGEVLRALGDNAAPFSHAALVSDAGASMTPRRTHTDGFFVSMIRAR